MGADLEQLVNSARWKAGSLRYSAAFSLTNAGYDSDIYFGTTPTRVPDYTFRAEIPFRLFLPVSKNVIFDVFENPEYAFYLKTENDRGLNNAFMGYVHFVLDRVYFQAGGGLSNVKQFLSPELMINVRQKTDELSGLALWQVSKGASVGLQYKTTTYTYDNPPDSAYNFGTSLNRREDFLNITAYLQRVSKTRFSLTGEYGSYTFQETISSFKDSRSYGIYGGVEFLPSPEGQREDKGIQGTINLGFKHFNVLDPQIKDSSGLVGNTSVSIGLFKLTSVKGFFSRDVQFSAYSSVTYYIMNSYGGGISRLLTRRSRLEYDLTFSRGNYPSDETMVGTQPQNLQIRTTVHSLRAIFQIQRDLEFSLIASLGNREGNATIPGGNRYFVGINLTYGIPAGSVPILANPFSR